MSWTTIVMFVITDRSEQGVPGDRGGRESDRAEFFRRSHGTFGVLVALIGATWRYRE